jgi:hypothetical protein
MVDLDNLDPSEMIEVATGATKPRGDRAAEDLHEAERVDNEAALLHAEVRDMLNEALDRELGVDVPSQSSSVGERHRRDMPQREYRTKKSLSSGSR